MQMEVLEEDIMKGKKLLATMSDNLDPDVTPLLTSLRVKIREKEIVYRRCQAVIGERQPPLPPPPPQPSGWDSWVDGGWG